MRRSRATGRGKPVPENGGPKLIRRWWVQVLVAAWVLAVVIIYFRLQLMRLLEVAQGR